MHPATAPTILLVHAEAPARLALATPLRAAGWDVVEAATADAALQINLEAYPAVALIEHAAGRDLCAALQSARPPHDLHCALITATLPQPSPTDEVIDLWLLRPFNDQQLVAQVRLLMRLAMLKQAHMQSLPLPYEEIIETTMDGFWAIRVRDERFIMVNDAYCQLSGYSREELLKLHIADVEADDDEEAVKQRINTIMATGLVRFESRHRRKDGTLFDVEISVRLIDSHEPLMVVFARDITEQRKTERRLQEQHEQFLTIFDAFPAILYVVDPATDEVLFVNKVFQELLGHDPVGKKCYCEFQGLSERCSFCTNEIILKTRQPHVWEYHNPIMNIDLLITDQIIRWPDGRDVRFELAINITTLKQVERAHENLSRELARKNRELEQIVYVTSHDLRSPLVNVQGFSRELQATLDDLSQQLATLAMPDAQRDMINLLIKDEIPESLHYILNGVSRMDTLLKGLLRLSRLGRKDLSIETLDIQRMVHETLNALDFEIKQAGVQVNLHPLPACRGDAMQVSQIFANLINNALKYLDPNRPGEITISATKSKGMVVYCIADNGMGLAPEHQEKIFELYYRLDPAHSEGEGLGLTIVRTIVDRHSGWIKVESTLGVGSQFFVALPEAL
ncbi:PAS domain S-box protein [Candidatus Oscillochloris fontis]|uniref:PAS domain S-box protein n=1 Tax=Candidatus Oscillochloris fontis TaxID=2496868 RepID=UPI0013759935|nr:PAS domain S-box protein [Candidatus Oscillochloris fontis]